MRRADPFGSNDPPIFRANALGSVRAFSCGERPELDYAPVKISSGFWKVTPVGFEMGVGSGLRNGLPLSRSHRNSMALSSCMVLWQCSMNIPPQSRNCILITTVPLGRSRYTSLRPLSATEGLLPFREMIWPSSKWMWMGWSQPNPPCKVHSSQVANPGCEEMRPKSAWRAEPPPKLLKLLLPLLLLVAIPQEPRPWPLPK